MRAKPFRLGDQLAWFHDEGHAAGYFHTYDGLELGAAAPRKVHVLLPRDYESGARRYPVLYVNDGDTAFWRGGPMHQTWRMQHGLMEANVEPLIIVAVVPLNRNVEYTHGEGLPGRPFGGAATYTAYMADGVKAFIDSNYRTEAAGERTAILGSSHGGVVSFFMGSRRPDAFGLIGAMSPSFWVGVERGQKLEQSSLVAPVLEVLRAKKLSVWIDWGLVRAGGEHNSVIEARATTWGREMVALLQREGTPVKWLEDATGDHSETSWARRFPLALSALFRPRGASHEATSESRPI